MKYYIIPESAIAMLYSASEADDRVNDASVMLCAIYCGLGADDLSKNTKRTSPLALALDHWNETKIEIDEREYWKLYEEIQEMKGEANNE